MQRGSSTARGGTVHLPHRLARCAALVHAVPRSQDRRMNRLRIGCLSGLLALLAACSRPADEDRLRETIAAMEAAIEQRDGAAFLDSISEDFSGSGGADDRRALRAMVLAHTMRHENINAVLGPLTVKMYEGRATVSFDALVTGGRFLPESGRQLNIVSHWRFEGGDWLCFRAEWR